MKRNRIIAVLIVFTLMMAGCSLKNDNSLQGNNMPMEETKEAEVSNDNPIDTFLN